MRDGRQQVVILYSHPLLGEGLGRLLAADPDLAVELVHVDDLDQAERALTNSPDVVILERTPPVQAIDLLRFAPSALLIDVGLDAGPTWTYRRDELAPRPEDLLRAIHDRDGHHGLPVIDALVTDALVTDALVTDALVTDALVTEPIAAAALGPASPADPAAGAPVPTGVACAATALRSVGA